MSPIRAIPKVTMIYRIISRWLCVRGEICGVKVGSKETQAMLESKAPLITQTTAATAYLVMGMPARTALHLTYANVRSARH